jgi:multicomponent K+:H+ antiporter subunit A
MLTTLALIVGIPFAVAALALALPRAWAGRAALLAPAAVVVLGYPLWRQVGAGGLVHVPVAWFPSLGIDAGMRVDRLGAFFVLLIGGVGLGVVQYAREYLGPRASGQFWAALLAFMGSMLGIVVSDSLLLMFVFWELTTITSALLIGMDSEDPEARRGAIQAFVLTGGGGLAMLAGIVLLGQMAGTYSLVELAARADAIVADPAHVVPLVLLLLGAFTKSAQFPFHFWLPGAMAAPAPVSAYLHSATMVKAGIFLLARLLPVFGASPYWLPILATVGLTTTLVAGWNAVRAYDLKQLLAHSTVAYLGLLTALYGYSAQAGTQGEVLGFANHALYKSSLFLLVGWLEKATGTRDLSLLDREKWFDRERGAAVLFGIGAFAMAGLPLLLGFMSKEAFFAAVVGKMPDGFTPAVAAAFASSVLATIYALKLVAGPFGGRVAPPADRGYPRSKISPWLLIVPALFLVPQVVGGLFPAWFLGSVLEPGTTWPAGLAVWHYLDKVVVLKLVSFAAGIGLYFVWRRLAALPVLPGPRRLSDGVAEGALGFAGWMSRAVQAGGHPRYVAVTLLAAVAALGAPMLANGGIPVPPLRWEELRAGWIPAAAVAAGGVLTVVVRSRITKLVTLAVVGYGMAIFYVVYRAPDLALTQLLVETVSLILVLLIFRRLPRLGDDARPAGKRAAHAAVAVAVGLATATLAWTAGSTAAPDPAGAEQLALSVPEAKGRNAVNVILVDFRGADTLGEAAVLAIAALGAVALFRAGRERGARGEG